MEEYNQSIDRLRQQIERGAKVEELYINEGWQFLRGEIEKALEGFKVTAVSVKALDDPMLHAATVGGYNALSSLLGTLDALAKAGQTARERLKEEDGSNGISSPVQPV